MLSHTQWVKIELKKETSKIWAHRAVKVGNLFYIYGGYSDSYFFSPDLFVINLDTFEVETYRAPENCSPNKRYGHIMFYHDSEIWIQGGSSTTLSSNFLIFNISNKQWRIYEPTPAPPPRYDHSHILHNGNLYIFGGGTGNDNFFNDFWIFNFEKQKWEQIFSKGDIPSQRVSATLQPYKDGFYIFGGKEKGGDRKNDLHFYDFVTNKWSLVKTLGDPPPPRTGHCSFLYNSKLYVMQGWNGGEPFSDIHYLDLITKRWNILEMKEHPDARVAAGVYFDAESATFYMHGGYVNSWNYLNDFWCLSLDSPSLTKDLFKMLNYYNLSQKQFVDFRELCLQMPFLQTRLDRYKQNFLELLIANPINQHAYPVLLSYLITGTLLYAKISTNFSEIENDLLNLTKNIPIFEPLQKLLKHEPNSVSLSNLQLTNDLKMYYSEESTKDFSIIVGSERIWVHKDILYSRSELFRGMFESVLQENQTNFVSDYSQKSIDSIREFVYFLYTDELRDSVSFNVALELLDCPEYYGLSSKKIANLAQSIISENLTLENVDKALKIAEQFEKDNLIEICTDFKRKHQKPTSNLNQN